MRKRSPRLFRKHIPGCMKIRKMQHRLLLDRGWNGGDYDMNVMINNALQFGLSDEFTGDSLKRIIEKYVRLGLITATDDVDGNL